MNLPVWRMTKTLPAFITHPNCPQQNAANERFNRTVREGFLETHEGLTDDLQQMNEALADWLTWYNGFRPHRSLNMTTPLSCFYNYTDGRLGCDHTLYFYMGMHRIDPLTHKLDIYTLEHESENRK